MFGEFRSIPGSFLPPRVGTLKALPRGALFFSGYNPTPNVRADSGPLVLVLSFCPVEPTDSNMKHRQPDLRESGSLASKQGALEPRSMWQAALITLGGLATVLWTVFLGWLASHAVLWFLGFLALSHSS